jgi:hypothetical protein
VTEVETGLAAPDAAPMGLAARLFNVVLSPRRAYEAIAARPRAFGALIVVLLIMIAAQSTFLSTRVGQNAAIEQQLSTMKSLGINVTDQMAQQMAAGAGRAPYFSAVSLLVFVPLFVAAEAGILLAIFTVVAGGGATFRQVFAVIAHSAIIGALAQVFSFPIMYLQGQMSSPTRLAVFFPMLDDMGFAYYLLAAIDLFYIWATINVAIGIAVVYKRHTGPVAALLLGIYAVIAVIIATVRTFA